MSQQRLKEVKQEIAKEWNKPKPTPGKKRAPENVRSYKKLEELHKEKNQIKSNL